MVWPRSNRQVARRAASKSDDLLVLSCVDWVANCSRRILTSIVDPSQSTTDRPLGRVSVGSNFVNVRFRGHKYFRGRAPVGTVSLQMAIAVPATPEVLRQGF